MISVTSSQLDAWIMYLIWPLARILALIATAPITSTPQFPRNAKIGLAVLMTVIMVPTLPPAAVSTPDSAAAMLLLAREIAIGVAMGLAMRVVFAAVAMAGDIIGLQMGLGYAQFFDPHSNATVPVLGQFLGLVVSLAFLSVNGHLLLLTALAESFRQIPADSSYGLATGAMALVQWGSTIFEAGVHMALPIIAALMITNAALAVLTRASPQLNIFAIGFPLTLGVGFIALLLVLPYLMPGFERLFDQGVQAMGRVAGR